MPSTLSKMVGGLGMSNRQYLLFAASLFGGATVLWRFRGGSPATLVDQSPLEERVCSATCRYWIVAVSLSTLCFEVG
jgi:hypothetical protein